MDPKWAVKHIADLMKKSKHTVVFTGAGMSTESGLPDFRSNNGLWDGKDPMVISHIDQLNNNPWIVARFYRDRAREALTHQPNRGHQILAEWETQGKIVGVATQNIDGYHQRALSQNVWELHGGLHLYCNVCKREYPLSHYADSETDDEFWVCPDCDGTIRPNITMFGELLPEDVFAKAKRQFQKAQLCVILGTSCSVYPAASLPFETIANGGQVVIINRTGTEMDRYAEYIINDWDITKSLEAINKLVQEK